MQATVGELRAAGLECLVLTPPVDEGALIDLIREHIVTSFGLRCGTLGGWVSVIVGAGRGVGFGMLRLLVGVVVALVVVVAALWLFQRRLIYLPTQRVPPIDMALPGWEEVTFNTADGLVLDAWFREPEEGQPVVMVFGGNAGNRADRASLGRGLASPVSATWELSIIRCFRCGGCCGTCSLRSTASGAWRRRRWSLPGTETRSSRSHRAGRSTMRPPSRSDCWSSRVPTTTTRLSPMVPRSLRQP